MCICVCVLYVCTASTYQSFLLCVCVVCICVYILCVQVSKCFTMCVLCAFVCVYLFQSVLLCVWIVCNIHMCECNFSSSYNVCILCAYCICVCMICIGVSYCVCVFNIYLLGEPGDQISCIPGTLHYNIFTQYIFTILYRGNCILSSPVWIYNTSYARAGARGGGAPMVKPIFKGSLGGVEI